MCAGAGRAEKEEENTQHRHDYILRLLRLYMDETREPKRSRRYQCVFNLNTYTKVMEHKRKWVMPNGESGTWRKARCMGCGRYCNLLRKE